MHLFNYNPYSIVNERPIAKIDAGCNRTLPIASTADLAATSFLRHGSSENRSKRPTISAQPWGQELVELIGIEPTTPCLQSRCSPN